MLGEGRGGHVLFSRVHQQKGVFQEDDGSKMCPQKIFEKDLILSDSSVLKHLYSSKMKLLNIRSAASCKAARLQEPFLQRSTLLL